MVVEHDMAIPLRFNRIGYFQNLIALPLLINLEYNMMDNNNVHLWTAYA